jgi:hypothetical protein
MSSRITSGVSEYGSLTIETDVTGSSQVSRSSRFSPPAAREKGVRRDEWLCGATNHFQLGHAIEQTDRLPDSGCPNDLAGSHQQSLSGEIRIERKASAHECVTIRPTWSQFLFEKIVECQQQFLLIRVVTAIRTLRRRKIISRLPDFPTSTARPTAG